MTLTVLYSDILYAGNMYSSTTLDEGRGEDITSGDLQRTVGKKNTTQIRFDFDTGTSSTPRPLYVALVGIQGMQRLDSDEEIDFTIYNSNLTNFSASASNTHTISSADLIGTQGDIYVFQPSGLNITSRYIRVEFTSNASIDMWLDKVIVSQGFTFGVEPSRPIVTRRERKGPYQWRGNYMLELEFEGVQGASYEQFEVDMLDQSPHKTCVLYDPDDYILDGHKAIYARVVDVRPQYNDNDEYRVRIMFEELL